MAFPTIKELQVNFFCILRVYWPLSIILIFTFYGALVKNDAMGHAVQAIGAAGAIVLLPIFKLQKNIWLYISAILLCFIGAAVVVDTRHVADVMGLGWLSPWSITIITIAVQGAIAAFIFLLLLYIFFFRLQNCAAMLVKVPLCMLFLLAAMGPAFMVFWMLLAFSGLFGPL